MMQDRDAIVVLCDFDTGIDASIAKSKLDANDIPCFLTQENMASLYQQALGIRVRLHVFEKDRQSALRILAEKEPEGEPEIFCPKCNSSAVERDFSKKFSETFPRALMAIGFAIMVPHKKIFRCLRCNHEF